MKISKEEAKELIKKTNGKFFSVKFIKKDGSERTLTVRNQIKNFFRGGKNTTNHIPDYINLFDVKDRCFKKVSLNRLLEIHSNHNMYEVISD